VRAAGLAVGAGAVVLVLAQAWIWQAGGPQRPTVGTAAPSGEARAAVDEAAPFYPPESGPGWTRLGVTAAHAAMVVRVTTDRDADPLTIARHIVTPLEPNYTEILVYFHAAHSEMPLRRIQWTARGGFVETVF